MRPRGALRVEVSEFRWPTSALSSGRRAREVRLSLAYLLPCVPEGDDIRLCRLHEEARLWVCTSTLYRKETKILVLFRDYLERIEAELRFFNSFRYIVRAANLS